MKFRYDKNTEKLIVSDSTRTEYHQIKIWLERHVKGYRFMPAFKMGVWNGKESYFDDGKVNMGLWKECLKACKEIGVKFEIENRITQFNYRNRNKEAILNKYEENRILLNEFKSKISK